MSDRSYFYFVQRNLCEGLCDEFNNVVVVHDFINIALVIRTAEDNHLAFSAHQFIEFLLQPEVIADCTATTNYANANLASKKLIDPEILANPAVYPDAATMARLWAPKPLSDKLTREMSRAFSKLKSK